MSRRTWLPITAIYWTLVVPQFASAASTDDILAKIERVASLGDKAEPSLVESLAEDIEKSPAEVSKALLPKLRDKNLTEDQMVAYVWALGLTRDQGVAGAVEESYRRSQSDLVRMTCLRALGTIGGKRAGEFLLSALDTTSEKEKRFEILNLLGQMQYEAALPKAEEVLKQDRKQFYWQPIFVFGKMGDKAVPFLSKRVSDSDPNTRGNAINVLGQWLIPPEAAKPLQEQFWREKDKELRTMILGSLERTITDVGQMKAFFEQVVATERDEEVAQFARETLDNMNQWKADVASLAQKKQPSAARFQQEYEQLFKSAGRQGSYEVLEASSTASDEPKLKALRERILQRNSDEAFYDYQRVNVIIMRNRMLKSATDQKMAQP